MKYFSLFFFANWDFVWFIFFNKKERIIDFKMDLEANFTEVFFATLTKVSVSQNLSLNQINKIYAGVGPGSFIVHRSIVVFLKVMQILNEQLQIFIINNLIFQAGSKENVVSLLTANKKKSYLQVFSHGKVLGKTQLIFKKKLGTFLQKYDQFTIYQDFNGFDHWLHFQQALPLFTLVKDWISLQPIEI